MIVQNGVRIKCRKKFSLRAHKGSAGSLALQKQLAVLEVRCALLGKALMLLLGLSLGCQEIRSAKRCCGGVAEVLRRCCGGVAEILRERSPKNLLTCLFVRRHFAEVAQG